MNDENFEEYRTRIAQSITDADIDNKVLGLKPAGKFRRNAAGIYRPEPYPGYTIITPPFLEETENIRTYARLADVQRELLQLVDESIYVPVPVSSFHITIADLISGSGYENKVQNSGYEIALRDSVLRVCYRAVDQIHGCPPSMRICGLTLFPSVIIAIVSIEDEPGYGRLLRLRELIYDDTDLKHLGVSKQFSFTGHVTLAYVEEIPTENSLKKLAQAIKQLNQDFFDKPLPLKIGTAELRKFEDMSRYYRTAGWANFRFMN